MYSQFRLTSASATFFEACLVTLAHILSTSPLFVSFAIFRAVSKVKEKVCFGKTFCTFTFLIRLKDDYSDIKAVNCFFSSHTQIHKFRFQLIDTFFHYLSPFSGFSSQSNPHNEDLFLILRNTKFHNQFYIWIVTSLESTTRWHRYNSF